jgi:transcriptional regulator with XRE-family HTH domain
MSNKNWVGELVKEERKKQRLSQQALSKQANVGINTLRSLENGGRDISLTNVEKVLSELGWELDAHPYD